MNICNWNTKSFVLIFLYFLLIDVNCNMPGKIEHLWAVFATWHFSLWNNSDKLPTEKPVTSCIDRYLYNANHTPTTFVKSKLSHKVTFTYQHKINYSSNLRKFEKKLCLFSKSDSNKISGLTSIEYLSLLSLNIFFVNPTHRYVYIRCSENHDTNDRESVDNFKKRKR